VYRGSNPKHKCKATNEEHKIPYSANNLKIKYQNNLEDNHVYNLHGCPIEMRAN